jgi:hypothetical protein
MKIADVLPQLTIQPLRRFADAWNVETIKSDKRDVFEQAILGSAHDIDSEASVRKRLEELARDLDYVRRGHAERLLRLVLNEPGYIVPDDAELIRLAVATDAIRHLDASSLYTYRSVLQVAWEDRVSSDEYRLITRLAKKLNICRRDQRVIEIKTINLHPISAQEAEQALRDLSNLGFVCRYKLGGFTQVLVPEEIADRLRDVLGIVLQSGAYKSLAMRLPISAIREALEGRPTICIASKRFPDRPPD